MRDVAAEVRAPTYSADFGAISHVELSDIFEAIFAFVACTNYGSMCEIECFLGAAGGIKAQTRTSIRIHPIKKKGSPAFPPPQGHKTDIYTTIVSFFRIDSDTSHFVPLHLVHYFSKTLWTLIKNGPSGDRSW